MKDQDKTREQLIDELAELRQLYEASLRRISEMEASENERKRAEEALRESEERYRTLIETIPHGIEEIDASGIIMYGNSSLHKIYNYGEGELIGKSILDLVATDPERKELSNYLVILVNEQPPPVPYFGQKRTKDGRVIDVQVAWAYKRDKQGRVTAFTSVITDITERKRAEEALRESERRLNEAQQVTHIGSWEWDLVTKTSTWSDEHYRLFGLKPQELPVTLELFLNHIHPDDQVDVRVNLEKASTERKSYAGEFRVVHPDGQVRICRGLGELICDEAGEPIRMVGTCQDITEHKLAEQAGRRAEETLRQSEERFALAVRGSNDGMWDWPDITKDDEWWSPRWYELLGYKDGEVKASYSNFNAFLHPDDLDRILECERAHFEERVPFDMEYRLKTKWGEYRWFRARGQALWDENGNPVRMSGSIQDINERKWALEAMQKSEERYRSLTNDVLDSSAVGIFILDSDFQVVWVNESLERYFGLRREDVIGKDKRQLIRERIKGNFADPEGFEEKVIATYGNNTYVENFECHVLPDGKRKERWLEHWSQPIRSGLYAGGRVEHYYDITERKRVEEALRFIGAGTALVTSADFLYQLVRHLAYALETRYAFMAECMDSPPTKVGILAFWTGQGFAQNFTYDLAGTPCENVIAGDLCHHPEEVQRFFPQDQDLLELGAQSYLGIALRDSSGKITGHLAVLDDKPTNKKDRDLKISILKIFAARAGAELERKHADKKLQESEERFALAVRGSNDGMWDWPDITKDDEWWSPRWYELLGYKDGEVKASYSNFNAFLHPDDLDRILECERAHFEERVPFDMEYRLKTKWGEYRWFRARGQALWDENGNPVRMSGSIQDINERKRAEKRLRDSHEQLRELSARLQSVREEEKSSIARKIHDELGQTLFALKMDLSSLKSQLSTTCSSGGRKSARRVDQILPVQKIRSMSKLIDSTIKTVQRISTELRPAVLDDLGLIAALEWQAHEFQTRTGIRCNVSSSLKELELHKNVSTAVFRIFQETLINVTRHAIATKVYISLNQKDRDLVLEIQDNGKGITDSEIASASSLGLLGMRERAILLGGETTIHGVPRTGTTVTVRVPIERS